MIIHTKEQKVRRIDLRLEEVEENHGGRKVLELRLWLLRRQHPLDFPEDHGLERLWQGAEGAGVDHVRASVLEEPAIEPEIPQALPLAIF